MNVFARARKALANAIDPGQEYGERVVGTPLIAGMRTTPDTDATEYSVLSEALGIEPIAVLDMVLHDGSLGDATTVRVLLDEEHARGLSAGFETLEDDLDDETSDDRGVGFQ